MTMDGTRKSVVNRGNSEMTTETDGPRWTQEQAIAFECARECLNGLGAIYTGLIEEERQRKEPDQEKIHALREKRSMLVQERDRLRLHDEKRIAWVRHIYGAECRAISGVS